MNGNIIQIHLKEIEKIPYVDLKNLLGRSISTLCFYDENGWHYWLPCREGLLKVPLTSLAEGFYFARNPQREDDAFFPFLDFIVQRASWPTVLEPFEGLKNDFLNLAASVKTFDILFDYSDSLGPSTSRLVSTQLEYLFVLCRSVYDLLQETIMAIWEKIELTDDNIKKNRLPQTFSKVVISGGQPTSLTELRKKYGLPEELSSFYTRNLPFFLTLREFRDRFVHRGVTFQPLIYVTEKGFAVADDSHPFASLGVWTKDHMLPNNLCSLRPAIAYLINQTLLTCEDFAKTIQRTFKFPPPIVPGFHLYLRGFFNDVLHKNRQVLEDCLWWRDT